MRLVFADTSFFVATIDPRDDHHDRAVEFMRGFGGEVLTTDFVIVELGNYLYRVKDRTSFEPVWQAVCKDPQFHVIEATRPLLERGVQRYINRPDKEWSLTDCVSFVVMEQHGIADALTTDGDFEQAGFKAVLL